MPLISKFSGEMKQRQLHGFFLSLKNKSSFHKDRSKFKNKGATVKTRDMHEWPSLVSQGIMSAAERNTLLTIEINALPDQNYRNANFNFNLNSILSFHFHSISAKH
jgi:hypothetical protein